MHSLRRYLVVPQHQQEVITSKFERIQELGRYQRTRGLPFIILLLNYCSSEVRCKETFRQLWHSLQHASRAQMTLTEIN